ncbi:MAG: type I-E CRISPR-associated protein Cse2/CasB [Caldilineaceae bacterium]|nr:type I-E CRISPR-associated protein Cse2/CasB [Caldilineaceae bacterium]
MSEQVSKRDERIQAFIKNLNGLDSGGRARLKRNAGKRLNAARNIGTFYRILPFDTPSYEEEIFFLVATLFPLATSGEIPSFGQSLKRARESQNARGMDRRFEVLLDADEDQLPFHLRQSVRLLYSKQIPINWSQLLKDLFSWSHVDKYVQTRWARDYFSE